jgi:hypothetical protein
VAGRAMEPRNGETLVEPTRSTVAEGHGGAVKDGLDGDSLPGVEGVRHARTCLLYGNRETSVGAHAAREGGGQSAGRQSPKPQAHATEESDEAIVPKKSANSRVTPEESMEGRAEANGKSVSRNAPRAQDRNRRAHETRRIGTRAKQNKGERFIHCVPMSPLPIVLRRPKVGARCGKSARRDLSGGRPERAVPTGTGTNTGGFSSSPTCEIQA